MSTGKEIQKAEGQEIEQTSQRLTVAPPVDVYENTDEVLVVADVPGATSESVNVSFENNELTIHASAQLPDLGDSLLFREVADVDYRRAFELVPGIDSKAIKAELSKGTLKIHLPKASELKPKQIPITVG